MFRFIILLVFLVGCSPSSLQDFQYEGEAASKALIKDLQKVQSHDDLVHMLPKLKKHFDRLADVMIQAKLHQKKHPEQEAVVATSSPHDELLLEEFQRIYLIEGARVLVEKAEREALLKLDAQERLMQKQKDMIIHPKK